LKIEQSSIVNPVHLENLPEDLDLTGPACEFRKAFSFASHVAGILLLPVFIAGCGGSQASSQANKAIVAPVDAVADAAERPKQFQGLFVTGAVPSEVQRRRFSNLMFQAAQVKPISDSEAAVHVLVTDGKGAKVGEVDWTVVREGSAWKLKSASLP
jgi:hypothetical protein